MVLPIMRRTLMRPAVQYTDPGGAVYQSRRAVRCCSAGFLRESAFGVSRRRGPSLARPSLRQVTDPEPRGGSRTESWIVH